MYAGMSRMWCVSFHAITGYRSGRVYRGQRNDRSTIWSDVPAQHTAYHAGGAVAVRGGRRWWTGRPGHANRLAAVSGVHGRHNIRRGSITEYN